MCANRNLFMPISLSMMTVTTALVMMVAVRATVGMTTVTATVIGIEIISSIESKTYKGGHSGHRKIPVIKLIKKYTDKEGTTLNTVCIKKNKVGNYRDRYDHPAETLAGVGFSTFCTYDRYRDRYDHPCPLRLPDNTALTQQFQFLIWSGLEPFSGQAVDDWSGQNRGIAGESQGAKGACSCPIRSSIDGEKNGVPEGAQATESESVNCRL